jgi:hypothetical protein
LSDVKARGYLNQVRRRAFGDLNHDISASGAALTDFILTERKKVGEGHRFFDLVRTKKAAQEITGFTAGKNELFLFQSRKFNLLTEIGHRTQDIKKH